MTRWQTVLNVDMCITVRLFVCQQWTAPVVRETVRAVYPREETELLNRTGHALPSARGVCTGHCFCLTFFACKYHDLAVKPRIVYQGLINPNALCRALWRWFSNFEMCYTTVGPESDRFFAFRPILHTQPMYRTPPFPLLSLALFPCMFSAYCRGLPFCTGGAGLLLLLPSPRRQRFSRNTGTPC